MSEISAREICLNLLDSTERGAEYSNIALDSALKKYRDLKDVDRRFISALYYGVLERKITLDVVIDAHLVRKGDKLANSVRQILRMGIYQILYLDSVPESAAVNESVKLAKNHKNKSAAGFVNALLRSFIRDGCRLPLTNEKLKDLSIEFSCPEWLIDMWQRDYGDDTTIAMLRTSIGKPPITARLNTCRYPLDDIVSELEAQGVAVKMSDLVADCCELSNCGSVEALNAYRRGMLHVQDISSQICCRELDPRAGDRVLDLCSAPGGKSFTIAEMMGDIGEVLAFDLHENRARLISSGAKRLGLHSVKAGTNNAKVFNSEIPSADRVLLDVPCSGLGVIRRKPEIRYREPEDIKSLPETQYAILSASSGYLKSGGILIYSTCTVCRAENDNVVEQFLKKHSDFEPDKLIGFPDWKTTITPDEFGSDGFFIAKMRKK